MSYKLVCTDMDGTLLGNKFTISQENIDAIQEVKKIGVKVALVTGRPYNAMKYFKDVLGDDIYIISTNGTYFKVDNYEYKKPLTKEEIKEIYEFGQRYNLIMHFKGCGKLIATNKVENEHPYFIVNSKNEEKDKIEIIENASLDILLERFDNDIMKCIVFSEDYETLQKGKAELKTFNKFVVESSSVRNFEIMKQGTSKGIAVEKFCELLNIKKDEVICIGDNENDLSMIEFAGFGIAMGNATEEIKLKADYVTDTNLNNGVAKALNKILLNK